MIGELAALGAAVSWAISALFYRTALLDAKPFSANVIRLALTSAVLLMFLAVVGKFGILLSLPLETAIIACMSGIIGVGFGDTMYFVSLRLIGVARSVPITCTYPLFTLLWAVLFLNEPVTLPVVLGAVVIVLGIWFLSQEKKGSVTDAKRRVLIKGVVLALATAVMWSFSMTLMALKGGSDFDHVLVINTARIVAAGMSFLACAPILDRSLGFLKARRRTVLACVVGGIVALGLGWFFLSYSLVVAPESRAVPISSTTPLFSTLAGIILFREKVTAKNVLGSIIIVAGIFLIFLV